MFGGRKIHHILSFNLPNQKHEMADALHENHQKISISGVQVKFLAILDKNRLRLIHEGEKGTYILKLIPNMGKNAEQMPANEHLTMQIARQVFGIETAENALIFFPDGKPAYITKRFDITENGKKLAEEEFASLAGMSPETHGENYKYLGSYLDLFDLMKTYLPAWRVEIKKLFQLILFNYLFSNGDAHLKNFSILETPQGDFRLSPAYDLLNTRIHIDDSDFALEHGLLPPHLAKGKIMDQFRILAKEAGLSEKQSEQVFSNLLSKSSKVETMVDSSFLEEKAKRNYLQAYQTRYKKLTR